MNKLILVVDDDDMQRRMAQFILGKKYTVEAVDSGPDCIEYLQKKKADLLLLDIDMPMMNGFRTLELIRQNPATANMPVIFLTASADSVSVIKAAKLGAVSYVKKPFVPSQLQEKVEKVLAE